MSPLVRKTITIHCSATKNGVPVSVRTITRWHKARGFSTIGYHLIIQPDGTVDRGRPLNKTGAHVRGFNLMGDFKSPNGGIINIGICLIGNDKFSLQQFGALRYQLDSIRLHYDVKSYEIYVHNDFDKNKTCPNMHVGNLISWYLSCDHDAIDGYLIKEKL